MLWSQVIEQKAAIRHLREAIRSRRIGHAYLFHGPPGVGKRAVAQVLAQTLQCTTADNGPCGSCAACGKVNRLTHPDVHVLVPQPSDATAEDLARFRKNLAENPYAAPVVKSQNAKRGARRAAFPVDRVHSDIHQAESLHPIEGPYKIFLLIRVETMAPQAANAFLKVLEEPTSQTVFVLTTNRTDLLLPTMTSRCQQVGFTALTRAAIAEELRQRDGIDLESAKTCAALSGGSYTRALELARNPELAAEREVVLNFLRHSYTQKVTILEPLITDMARQDRDRLENMLRHMLSWIRDLVLYRAMGSDAQIENVDHHHSVRRFTHNMPSADLDAMEQLVENALLLTTQNVHAALLLTALSQKLGIAMRKKHSGKLAPPLTDV